MDLTIELGINAKQPLILKNPVMAASGTVGYGTEYAKLVDIQRLGAIVSPSITAHRRRGSRGLRMAETPAGMLSSTGLQNPGLQRIAREMSPIWASWSVPVIVSIAGVTADDFAYLAGELDELPGVRGLEINLASAEPLEHEYPEMERTARVEAIVAAARARTGLPLLAKLPPQTSDVHSVARAAELAGADAIVLVDALRGMKIDTWTGRPVLGGGWGGLSGPAIHPIAVWLIYQASEAVTVPVIGVGGISSTEDALEFILAGATAVEVGTTTFVEPRTAMTIADELSGMMVARGYTSLASAVSRAHQAALPEAMA